MHIYKIFLNEKTEEYEHSMPYTFGGNSKIRLEISQGKACVTIPMNAIKTQEDFLALSPIFRDALRKALQVHIILFGKDLYMESVSFEIDGKACKYTSGDVPGFPFVFSMLGGKKIRLVPLKNWKALIQDILNTTKSRQDQDLRFSAVFAYWAGKTRPYEVDRFQNYWTAMNACYSYLANLYNERLAKDSMVSEQLAKWNEDLKSSKEVKKSELEFKTDNDEIHLLAHWLTGTEEHLTRGKLQGFWGTYSNEDEKNPNVAKRDFRPYAIERELRKLQDRDLKNLYEDAYSGDPERLARWNNLVALAESVNTNLFCLLLLFLPYHYRNAFLHGSKTLCLFMAFNDFEYTVLHAVNLFLDRFLGSFIPRMFYEDLMKDEIYESLKKFAFDCTVQLKGAV